MSWRERTEGERAFERYGESGSRRNPYPEHESYDERRLHRDWEDGFRDGQRREELRREEEEAQERERAQRARQEEWELQRRREEEYEAERQQEREQEEEESKATEEVA